MQENDFEIDDLDPVDAIKSWIKGPAYDQLQSAYPTDESALTGLMWHMEHWASRLSSISQIVQFYGRYPDALTAVTGTSGFVNQMDAMIEGEFHHADLEKITVCFAAYCMLTAHHIDSVDLHEVVQRFVDAKDRTTGDFVDMREAFEDVAHTSDVMIGHTSVEEAQELFNLSIVMSLGALLGLEGDPSEGFDFESTYELWCRYDAFLADILFDVEQAIRYDNKFEMREDFEQTGGGQGGVSSIGGGLSGVL